jgi:cytochrome oxidase Cu insertion factor (SCO1/SenC/PrrC family)
MGSAGKALLGGPFELEDEEGVPRTSESYKGEYLLLYFGTRRWCG